MKKQICQRCKIEFYGEQEVCWYCREGKKWVNDLYKGYIYLDLYKGCVDLSGGDYFRDEKSHLWVQRGDNYFDP